MKTIAYNVLLVSSWSSRWNFLVLSKRVLHKGSFQLFFKHVAGSFALERQHLPAGDVAKKSYRISYLQVNNSVVVRKNHARFHLEVFHTYSYAPVSFH